MGVPDNVTLTWDLGVSSPCAVCTLIGRGVCSRLDRYFRQLALLDSACNYVRPGESANSGNIVAYNTELLLPVGLHARFVRIRTHHHTPYTGTASGLQPLRETRTLSSTVSGCATVAPICVYSTT